MRHVAARHSLALAVSSFLPNLAAGHHRAEYRALRARSLPLPGGFAEDGLIERQGCPHRVFEEVWRAFDTRFAEDQKWVTEF
jgi:hypothetical protein